MKKADKVFSRIFFSCSDLMKDNRCRITFKYRIEGCEYCCVFCPYRPKYRPTIERGECSKEIAICPVALKYLRRQKGIE